MSVPPITELNARARDIIRVVVESYLNTGTPIGSRTIAQFSGFNLSPASIRKVMQDLEELVLLAAPHTSAGRLPTESGLRLFVDGMMHAMEPSAEERAAIESRVTQVGPVEEALAATTAALSGQSACANLVFVPKRELVLRQLSFVPLSAEKALAVLVSDSGAVENRVIHLPRGIAPSALVEAGRAVWSEDGDRRPVLIVRGQGRLIDAADAAQLERITELLDDLEGKQEISRLLDSAAAGDATRIFIGAENQLFSLSGSSVIANLFYGLGGRVVGVVGVIGPTRLNYARVVPMVDFTAATLARLMS